MPVEILSMTHDLTTLLFGIYISAFFLGVRQNYKNTGILFLFFCGEGLTYLLFSLTISDPFARQIYPLIVHLPLAIFLFLYYKYPLLSCFTSIFSAYLCCQVSTWVPHPAGAEGFFQLQCLPGAGTLSGWYRGQRPVREPLGQGRTAGEGEPCVLRRLPG